MTLWVDPSLDDVKDWPRVPCVHALSGSYETRNFCSDSNLSLFSRYKFCETGLDKHGKKNNNPWIAELFGGWAPCGPVVLASRDFELSDLYLPNNYKENIKIKPEWLDKFAADNTSDSSSLIGLAACSSSSSSSSSNRVYSKAEQEFIAMRNMPIEGFADAASFAQQLKNQNQTQ